MKKALPWILVAASLALNAFFIGGYVHATQLAQRVRSGEGAATLLAERLDFSDAQRQKLTESRRVGRDAARALFQQNRVNNNAFWQEILKEEIDRDVLRRTVDEAANRYVEFTLAIAEELHGFMAELDEEQRDGFVRAIRNRPLLRGRFLMSGTFRGS